MSVNNASGVSARDEYKECSWCMQRVGFLAMVCSVEGGKADQGLFSFWYMRRVGFLVTECIV